MLPQSRSDTESPNPAKMEEDELREFVVKMQTEIQMMKEKQDVKLKEEKHGQTFTINELPWFDPCSPCGWLAHITRLYNRAATPWKNDEFPTLLTNCFRRESDRHTWNVLVGKYHETGDQDFLLEVLDDLAALYVRQRRPFHRVMDEQIQELKSWKWTEVSTNLPEWTTNLQRIRVEYEVPLFLLLDSVRHRLDSNSLSNKAQNEFDSYEYDPRRFVPCLETLVDEYLSLQKHRKRTPKPTRYNNNSKKDKGRGKPDCVARRPRGVMEPEKQEQEPHESHAVQYIKSEMRLKSFLLENHATTSNLYMYFSRLSRVQAVTIKDL